ncbi:MAG: BolA/IbaG family iron-sulfur metabolism protein [Bdellovibrionales bacterium]|nr:BolA/IbaG family iron-sulfur metabolism protein [Bdellovibrionales bacterium]
MSPDQMKARLEQSFPGGEVQVRDMTGTEDHYEVFVKSEVFQGLSRIDAQRKVMDAFAVELKSGEVHALTIKTQV